MNRTPDVDLVLREYFADDGLTAPDYVLDVVAGRIGRQRQRRAWPFQWRTTVTPLKLAAGLAAAIVVAIVGFNLISKEPPVGNPATPTPAAQTILSTSIPTAAPASPRPIQEGALAPGRYRMEAFGIAIVADVPAGWVGDRTPYISSGEGFDQEQVLITFMQPDGLFSDPCQWDLAGTGDSSQAGDVEVGPTAGDLVDALRANTAYTSSTPGPVTFGTLNGMELELQLPDSDVISTCDAETGDAIGSYYVFSGGSIYAQGSNNRWQLSIVDVGGTRLVTVLSYFEGTPQADLDAGRAIVESLEFTP